MSGVNPHRASRPDDPDAEPRLLSQRVRSLRLPDRSPTNRRVTPFTAILCVLLAASTATLGYLLWKEKRAHAEQDSVESATPAVPPPTTAPTLPLTGMVLESKGYVIPARQILVSPKINGMIEKLNVQEGLVVQKGDVLAVLESVDYKADVDRATALLASTRHRLEELERGFRPEEISQAKAELAEAEATLTQAEADWKRAQELKRKNVISNEEVDAVESRFQSTSRRVDRLRFAAKLVQDGPRIERIQIAKAEVQQAEAELAKAQWRLDNCVIRAPITGTILKKNAEEGNIVNPIAFNGSFSLCEMADLADLEVELTIQERDISRIFRGQKCTVRSEAFPDRLYQGYVSRLMPIADRAKGAVPVRVKIAVPGDEQGVYLKPEMGAVVSFYDEKSAIPTTMTASPRS